MTATDELCRLLDERGAHWSMADEDNVCWLSGLMVCRATDVGDGRVELDAAMTPAQAVEATLGRGTCKMIVDNHYRVDRVTISWGCVCSACGGFHKFTHGEGWAFCPSCGREVDE